MWSQAIAVNWSCASGGVNAKMVVAEGASPSAEAHNRRGPEAQRILYFELWPWNPWRAILPKTIHSSESLSTCRAELQFSHRRHHHKSMKRTLQQEAGRGQPSRWRWPPRWDPHAGCPTSRSASLRVRLPVEGYKSLCSLRQMHQVFLD